MVVAKTTKSTEYSYVVGGVSSNIVLHSVVIGTDVVQDTNTTLTQTKPLPTFIAQVDSPAIPMNNQYLQVGAYAYEDGTIFVNITTLVKARELVTTFSFACEGFLLQTNTSYLGPDGRFIADSISTSQAPIYFDPDSIVDDTEVGINPLYYRIEAKQLKCYVVRPTKNKFQYSGLYEEFFVIGCCSLNNKDRSVRFSKSRSNCCRLNGKEMEKFEKVWTFVTRDLPLVAKHETGNDACSCDGFQRKSRIAIVTRPAE